MQNKLLSTIILFLFSIYLFGGNPTDISRLFAKSSNSNIRVMEFVDNPILLDINPSYLSNLIKSNYKEVTLTLPVSEFENVELRLEQFKVLSDDFILRTSSGDTLKNYKPGLFYRGEIVGKEGIVTLSVFEEQVFGLVSIKDVGNYNLVQDKENKSQYILYNDFKIKTARNFVCNTPDTPIDQDIREIEHYSQMRTGNCVKFYLEGDYELEQDKGSVSAASNYMTALFAEVAELYDNEQISIEIQEIMVWNTPDNYSNNSSDEDLDIFQNNNPNFNGDLASLMSLGGGNLGGLAYVGVLCSSNWAYSFCGIDGSFQNVPAYSWDVEVCAHEWGHNFGSRHTHACVWNGNNTQIDDCGNKYFADQGETPEGEQCFNPNNPILPNDGTIMSYCHLIWSVGINLALGFGTQPGNLIRSEYNSANCLTSCTGGVLAPVAAFSAEPLVICQGETVYFTDISTNGPTEWNWTFEGGDPGSSGDQNVEVAYYTAGTFDVTLVASNIAGSNTHSENNLVTVNAVAEPNFSYTKNMFQVTLTNLSQNATEYYWEFGDGETSTATNPTHTYDIDGVYTITLYASNALCTGYQEYSVEVEIITPPTANFNFTQTDFCKPSTIQFFDQSSENATTRLWNFEGGTPATSTAKNPSVTYNSIGDFNVKLTVSNELFSNSKELLDTIHIRTKPVSDFNYTIVGNTVNFINSSQNANSYLWYFGDNTTSTETNPVHVFAGGSYQVSLKAINDCGDSTKIKTISITLEPVAAFSAEEVSGCSPFSTTFHNNSNTTNISWVFEGGSPATSTQQNPVVNYLIAGQFDVTIYATNALGTDTLIMNNFIHVLAQPTGAFSKTVNAYTANFIQTTNNVTGFYWNFGDGSPQSTQVNPSHTYQNDGIYTVQFVYFNDCDTLTYSNSVVIANPPVANFTYSNTTGCSPLTVTFTNTSSSNSALFNWTFEGGNPASSTAQNPVVTFNNKGTFNVSLKVTNAQGNNTKTIEDLVTVNSKPVPNFSKTNVGLNYTFSYTGEPASQVKWHFGDGTSALGQQVNHTYSSAGTYELKVISTNSCGSDTLVHSLVITLNPTANFTYNTHQGCAPLVVQYTNTSSSANSVFWLFEGGIPSFSTSNNPQVTYTTGGNFEVELIAFGNSSNDTLIMESVINVNDGPTVNFNHSVSGATASFTNLTSSDALTYFWDFGDGSVSELKNPTHTYAANGNYNVSLFANNQCGTKSLTKTVLITTVKTNELNLEKLVLYPNPNDGEFSLEFDTPESGDYNFKVLSSTGQKVAEVRKAFIQGYNKIDFQLRDIPVGLYLLKAEKDGKFYNILFSKQ